MGELDRRLARARSLQAPLQPATDDCVYAVRQLVVTRTRTPAGLRFTGEIDVSNVGSVAELLDAAGGAGELHLDLRWLRFCDVSGIRALVAHAAPRVFGRRLLLHGLPAQIEKVLDVTGWSDMPGLSFCACDMDE